ncbi:MAG TPA: FtsQ-type POTRA domain-containing protein [Candidatus Paceibacterota bacterium]|jgi:Cell division septal protein
MAERALFQQTKLRARRRARAWRLLGLSVAAAAILYFSLSLLSQLSALQIERVVVTGAHRVPEENIRETVLAELSGNYGGIFSRSNVLLYPKSAIRTDVLAVPAVKSVNISRSDMHTLSIDLEERVEVALWCEGPIGETERCSSVDENGQIFARTTVISSDRFVYRGAVTSIDESRDVFVSPDFRKLQFFMTQLSGLSVGPREIFVGTDGYLTISLSNGGKIIIDATRDLSDVLSDIALVISDKSVAPDLLTFLNNLDYIKFDSGSKVVYKMK